MCKSIAEGGQRCAAHTRPAAEAALAVLDKQGANALTDAHMNALSDYASTPTGQAELGKHRFDTVTKESADALSRREALESAMRTGQRKTAASREIANRLRAEARINRVMEAAGPEAQWARRYLGRDSGVTFSPDRSEALITDASTADMYVGHNWDEPKFATVDMTDASLLMRLTPHPTLNGVYVTRVPAPGEDFAFGVQTSAEGGHSNVLVSHDAVEGEWGTSEVQEYATESSPLADELGEGQYDVEFGDAGIRWQDAEHTVPAAISLAVAWMPEYEEDPDRHRDDY